MNTSINSLKKLIPATIAIALLTACTMSATKPPGADMARGKLSELQSDPQLASRAPVAVKEAERAVIEAEKPQSDKALSAHLVLMADRKVDIASAQAHTALFEEQRKTLREERQTSRLESRTREADLAHIDADTARVDADEARNDADAAMIDTAIAQDKNDDLQKQINALNAKNTDRGLVVTLGDLLFDTGNSTLKGGAANHLDKLALFLKKYSDRNIIIEGHTDNVGSNDANIDLSQRRADTVQSWLISEGINPNRITSSGKGENSPVASNDSSAGRQENRRVEVIIINTNTTISQK